MKDLLSKVVTWFKANPFLGIVAAIIVFFIISGTGIKKLFRKRPVRRRRRVVAYRPTSRRRTLPRSVGMRKVSYNKNGTKKKPWQVKGSEAARRHMREIRRRRSR